jgi:hypothetical protein
VKRRFEGDCRDVRQQSICCVDRRIARERHIGGLMICLGGYWFWFFITIDVAA